MLICIFIYTVQKIDYEAIDVILTFEACEKRKCVDVVIFDESVNDQEPESFSYHLTRTPGLDPRIELDPANGTVMIISDEGEHRIKTPTKILFFSSLQEPYLSMIQSLVIL